jgi:SAM-dependent methyltransferase
VQISKVRPPALLSARIGGAEADYESIGRAHADRLRTMLPPDWDWAGKKVLDFGCGTGRSLAHFEEEADTAEFWGCDIDGESIAWANEHLNPPFHFVRNDENPPVPLPAAEFDLIYGFSVFTHLLDSWSDWLLEIHRLLVVGGFGVFTFLGEGMIGEITGRAWDPNRVGMIKLDGGRPWMIGGPNALHSEWWLRGHWGRAFVIENVHPYFSGAESRLGHGLIVVRKDERPAPSRQELEELMPDEPREVKALLFNLELLLERSALLWQTQGMADGPQPMLAELDAHAAEARWLRQRLEELTTSKSWRFTAPLRSLRRSVTTRRTR